MINNESIEMFFASLDEESLEELIEIYETGDESKLKEYLDKLPGDIPKEELIKNLEMLKEMKDMGGF
ncbi:hypothetical protein [Clostridium oceanicum]|uniref:Magnesium transporter MgtE intracellular domain-containing protein n=1 Tax=Clostridium oceanicum TaxID=1543 RepID=A0ABN1JKT3_9CLOT